MKFLKLPETVDEIVNYKKEIEKEIETLEIKIKEIETLEIKIKYLEEKINIQKDYMALYKRLINIYVNNMLTL